MNHDPQKLGVTEEATSNSELGWVPSHDMENQLDQSLSNNNPPDGVAVGSGAEDNALLGSALAMARVGLKVFPVQ